MFAVMRNVRLLLAFVFALLFVIASPERAEAQHAGFPTAVDASRAGLFRPKKHKSPLHRAVSRRSRAASRSSDVTPIAFSGLTLQGGWGMSLGNRMHDISNLLVFEADLGVRFFEVLELDVGLGLEAFEYEASGGLVFLARISYVNDSTQLFIEYEGNGYDVFYDASFSSFSLGLYYKNLGGKISRFDFGQPAPYGMNRGCLGFSLLIRWHLFNR